MNNEFKVRVDKRQIRIGVIGLGYVGLPLVIEFAKNKFLSTGFDIDREKVDMLMSGNSYIKYIPQTSIEDAVRFGNFTASSNFTGLDEIDVIIICVPTPLTPHREPDLKYVVSTGESIYPHLKRGDTVILESTTYPGTTDEVLLPILEKSGLKCGSDFHLVFSPEREDPGNKNYSTQTIPKIVGGHTSEACDRAVYLFSQIINEVVSVSSTQNAEAVKLTENIFRSVNIALVNELKMIFTKMGIDIWEIVDAAKTKPFGFMPFYPGPGLGGHCIPIDPFYLTWKAREFDCQTRFIEIAGEINTAMPDYVVHKLMDALNERGKALNGSRILIIGLAYKKDVGDYRESPSLKLFEILLEKGAHVDFNDPYIHRIGKTRAYRELEGKESVDLTPESITSYDAVLIATDHSSIDYEALVRDSKLVVDTRNVTKNIREGREKIVKA